MKKIFALVTILAITACTAKIKCDAQDKFVTTITPIISSQLACSNPDAIRKDLDAALTKAGLCKRDEAKAKQIGIQSIGISPTLCPIAAALVVEAIGTQVPADWKCDGGAAKAGLQAALTAACLAGVTSTDEPKTPPK